MSLKRNRNQGNSVSNSGSPKSQNTTKKVVDIILSPNHIAYNSPEDIALLNIDKPVISMIDSELSLFFKVSFNDMNLYMFNKFHLNVIEFN